MRGLSSRFDWYEATFDDLDDGRVPVQLAQRLRGTITRGTGRNGYAECINVERGGDVLAKVYGRSVRLGEIHIESSSESCDEVVPVLRDLWPAHRVSRVDASVDFAADFDELDARAVAFARKLGLKFSIISDSEGGATRRIGSPKSEVFVRVYKKSEQLRAKFPQRAAEIPSGIVRAELVVRPGKSDVKALVGSMSADDCWGLSKWAQQFAADFVGISAPRVATHFRRPSDWSRALHHLGLQYGPMIQRRAAEMGADEVRAELLDALGLS